MKKVVYLIVMTLTYPIWKLSAVTMDALYAVHKELIKWIER